MSDELTNRLRADIRTCIDETGRHQVTIAEDLGITTKHLCAMLTGRATLTLEWAARIAEACGRTLTMAVIEPDGNLRDQMADAMHNALVVLSTTAATSTAHGYVPITSLANVAMGVVQRNLDQRGSVNPAATLRPRDVPAGSQLAIDVVEGEFRALFTRDADSAGDYYDSHGYGPTLDAAVRAALKHANEVEDTANVSPPTEGDR